MHRIKPSSIILKPKLSKNKDIRICPVAYSSPDPVSDLNL
jgi:hypothetical protein